MQKDGIPKNGRPEIKGKREKTNDQLFYEN